MSTVHHRLHDIIFAPYLFIYRLIQILLSRVLSPDPPLPGAKLARRKVAVIGAGLTGVSAAAHCVGHGFDVVLFEKGENEKSIGGIWTKVNNTSGLQINSVMYRFHPKVYWREGYPTRNEIVEQVQDLWHTYHLEEKTQFGIKVEKVYKDDQGRWIVNNPSYGRFDGIIAAVGTCGGPKTPHIPGQDKFKGEIIHSSQLDGKNAKDKKVLIIGGGFSHFQ